MAGLSLSKDLAIHLVLLTKLGQHCIYFTLVKKSLERNGKTFVGRAHNFETAVSKPISLLPDLVILSKDHFQSMCVYIWYVYECVCVRAFKRTNIGSCSFWKAASRERANTARGRWREEQSKQGTYTGENRDARAALGHTLT